MEIVERAEYFREENYEPRETLAVSKERLRRAINVVTYAELERISKVEIADRIWEDLQHGV